MSEARQRGVGRPPAGGEDKRQRILDEASDVFATDGYEASSLDQIARRARISKAGLLHHFGSKVALYSAVLEQWDGQNQDQWTPSEEPWDFLDSWVDLAVRNERRPETIALYTSLLPSVMNPDHPAHGWMRAHLERAVELIASGFEEGKRRGYVKADAPSIELARSVTAYSDGIQVLWLCQLSARDGQESGVELPMNLAEQMRIFIDMIKRSWGI
ncbi:MULTISPECIES: TetR/AcrR family transcriptional regulator [unclassified Arthrobacter]|uniref:TetR/AcrR family transcriptional regulator n=1 Tax=unclassified Arthrobacter TaxID=235627 RepID=UPI002882F069|nr:MULTISPECIES: TetR/AcrR family transcriptional regulator [unclassified Arthrobacter]